MDKILEGFYKIMLLLDSFIYGLINWIYRIILNIAGIDIFTNHEIIDGLVNRIYIIVGVVMLFLIAYSLLKNMVNPDEALKGKQSPIKIISNVVISVVLIALVPTIFQFAMAFQQSLLQNNTIEKLVLGTNSSNKVDDIFDGGYYMSLGVFQAFFHPSSEYCQNAFKTREGNSGCTLDEIKVDNPDSGKEGEESQISYTDFWEKVRVNKNFLLIQNLSNSVVSKDIEYMWIISTIAGIFLVFVLLKYCIELAVRTIKLAVFQLMAPIPILARLLPNEQGNKVFSNWVKAVLSTYTEVFVRLAILYFSVLIIIIIKDNWTTIFTGAFSNDTSPIIGLLTLAFILIGIVFFIKDAPQILKDITGLDSSKFNPLKDAKQSFAMIAGGLLGGSPAAALRAYNEAGESKKLTDMSAIGNQYKRKLAKKDAEQLQKDAGMNALDRFITNRRNGVRTAFGVGTLKEAADKKLEQYMDVNGHVMQATNDSGSDIGWTDENGVRHVILGQNATIDLNDSNVNRLNETKAKNELAKSSIAETVKKFNGVKDGNQKMVDFKGTMEDKAKGEFKKNKYFLRSQNADADRLKNLSLSYNGGTFGGVGNNYSYRDFEKWLDSQRPNMKKEEYNRERAKLDSLTYLNFEYTDANGNIHSFGSQGATQTELEKWLEGERERMSSDQYAKLQHQLAQSINVWSVEHFVNENGFWNNKENDDIKVMKKDFVQTYENAGVYEIDANGNVSKNNKKDNEVHNYDGRETELDWSTVTGIKDHVKVINDDIGLKVKAEKIKQSNIDADTAAIDRMLAQGKEQVERAKTEPKYKAYEASDKANDVNKKK